MAALVVGAWQILAVQHLHADSTEPECALCNVGEKHDELVPASRIEAPAILGAPEWRPDLQVTARTVDRPLQLARAPPTH